MPLWTDAGSTGRNKTRDRKEHGRLPAQLGGSGSEASFHSETLTLDSGQQNALSVHCARFADIRRVVGWVSASCFNFLTRQVRN